MDLIKEAFIEGYKQRAEASNLIFDNASRMYAIHLFDKWKAKQLMLGGVASSSDLIVVELSDDELKIITIAELEQWKQSAIDFDGFEGWIVRGRLIK